MRSLLSNFLLLSSTLIQAVAYSPAASAQGVETTTTRKITLEEVIDFARKNYPAIQAAKAGQRAAESQVGVARTSARCVCAVPENDERTALAIQNR
jgi:outer membrane protein TolC